MPCSAHLPSLTVHTCACPTDKLGAARAGGVVVSIERDWLWALTARRFLWQASSGSRNADLRARGLQPIGKRVQVRPCLRCMRSCAV